MSFYDRMASGSGSKSQLDRTEQQRRQNADRALRLNARKRSEDLMRKIDAKPATSPVRPQSALWRQTAVRGRPSLVELTASSPRRFHGLGRISEQPSGIVGSTPR